MVFDTMGGQRARRAAEEAIAAESDLMIGPLAPAAVAEARSVAHAASIPMLLLSNNARVASSGSWLMGYLPEQQLDLLLGYAIADGRQRFGIIAEDSAFGKRLATHAQRLLLQSGLPAVDSMVLREQALESEDLLKRAIRSFSRYVAPVEDEIVAEGPPVFDALILLVVPNLHYEPRLFSPIMTLEVMPSCILEMRNGIGARFCLNHRCKRGFCFPPEQH